jgi:hypothetical protein
MVRNLNYLEQQLKEGVNKRWLIENLIPMGEIVILYAPTNQYKTFLSLKIALEVATGSQELGATVSGSVRIFSPDTNMEDLVPRIRGLLQESYSNQDISESLLIEDETLDLTANYRHEEKDERAVEEDHFTWWDCGEYNDFEKLVIIDTLSQSLGEKSINDDGAIRKAIKNLKTWIKGSEYNCSILVIAHAGKNASKGIMGSSIQHNDFPTVLKVKKGRDDQMYLFREKMKSKAEGTSIPFVMRRTVAHEQDTLYVEIGKNLTPLEDEIIRLNKQGLTKKQIKSNTENTFGKKYNNSNSYGVVLNRAWNKLLNQGFIDDSKQSNK